MTKLQTEIAILGGGLSGLVLCDLLTQAGRNAVVLEARARAGGRILGLAPSGQGTGVIDAGPAWVWPHNHSMLNLLERLGLDTFAQYSQGRLVFEDAAGSIRRDLDFSPMAGTLRVVGGLQSVIDALMHRIGPERVRLSHRVDGIQSSEHGVDLSGTASDQALSLHAEHAVVTLPPRIIARDIRFQPELSPSLAPAFQNIPTWMAGHAKFVTTYATPFWRDQGLSGDAVSHRGPLAEIHDASPHDGGFGALFGFLGVTAQQRAGMTVQDLGDACLSQLTGLFGEAASGPHHTILQDWAVEPCTATQADWTPPAGHPDYRIPSEIAKLGSDRILFAGTELAPREGGFLEGAVAAAEAIADRILSPQS